MKRGAIFAAMILAACLARPAGAAEGSTTLPSPGDLKTAVIQLQGKIDDDNRDALFKRFDEARQYHVTTVILNIDTWGGFQTDAMEISRFIKRQDDIHVIAFVQDKAISAGALIAMACDEIVMSNAATLGDCAPIIFGPDGHLESLAPTERAKEQTPLLLQEFADSAQRNRRNPLLAAGMVDVTRVIYWVQNKQGERRFVDANDYKEMFASGLWFDVPGAVEPIKNDQSILTVSSDQAVAYGLASGKAATAQALAQQRGYDVVCNLPTISEKMVEFLNGAVVRGILLVIFFLCLYVVLHAPGHGVAEVLGLIALGLMLGVPMLTGYAQWWEIIVVFVGLALISFEILLPGHIFPGVTGAILVIFGMAMTFVPLPAGGFPDWHKSWPQMEKGLVVVAAAMGISLFLWFWMNRFLPKMPYINRLILTATSGGNPLTAPSGPAINTVIWPPIGGVGRAITELKPGGTAEFYDPRISDLRPASVVSESGFLTAGTELVVREVAGSRITVRRKD